MTASSVRNRNEDWLKTRTWDLPVTLPEYLQSVLPNPGETLKHAVVHRLTLPSAEAMPATLRTAIGHWLRDPAGALTAAGDFDEAQHPRGPGGKFATKDDADRGAKESSPLPPGWRTVPTAERADRLMEQYTKEWHYGESQARQEVSLVIDRSGTVALIESEDGKRSIDIRTQLAPADQAMLASTLDHLNETTPVHSGIQVTVNPPDPSTSVYGRQVGMSKIVLDAGVFGQTTASKIAEGAGKYFSAPAGDVPAPEYVLTHEYGHAVWEDRMTYGRPNGLGDHEVSNAIKSLPPVSEYGDPKRTNSQEAYAEAFASWQLSPPAGPHSSEEPLPARLATIEGWGR